MKIDKRFLGLAVLALFGSASATAVIFHPKPKKEEANVDPIVEKTPIQKQIASVAPKKLDNAEQTPEAVEEDAVAIEIGEEEAMVIENQEPVIEPVAPAPMKQLAVTKKQPQAKKPAEEKIDPLEQGLKVAETLLLAGNSIAVEDMGSVARTKEAWSEASEVKEGKAEYIDVNKFDSQQLGPSAMKTVGKMGNDQGPANVKIEKRKQKKSEAALDLGAEDQQVIRKGYAAINLCYKKSLKRDADLSGKMTAKLSIDGEGNVAKVNLEDNDLDDQPLTDCIQRKLARLKFKAPLDGSAAVTLPLVLQATTTTPVLDSWYASRN